MKSDEEVLIEAGESEDFGFSNPAAQAALGTGLIGASSLMMRNQTPGGVRLAAADYSRNFLPGFYGQGILPQKLQQYGQYGLEGVKTAGRLGFDATVGFTRSEFYNKTGVSPVLLKNIKEIELVKSKMNFDYLEGTIDKTSALREIKKAEKIAFFKASSDKANRMIFLGKSSDELDNIVGNAVKETNKKDFIKSMGIKNSTRGNEVANYVFQRQPDLLKAGFRDLNSVTPKNLKFIKYSNLQFANVLRGAQFDKNVYNAMLGLKNLGNVKELDSAVNLLEKMKLSSVKPIGNNRVVFSVSPSIKPNYDWGGYNSVGIWDRREPGKIRLIATDVPNTPVKGTSGKVLGIKYVDSSEIKISDPKIKKIFAPKLIDPAITERHRLAALKGWETRRANLELQGIKIPETDLLKDRNPVIGKERYSKLQNLTKKRKDFKISGLKRLSKVGRRLPGAAGILLNGYALWNAYTSKKKKNNE
tara:strand:- start:851 stop:2272 length:1422 start_codon:yes stop_codon:yes gene_type:complete